MDTDELARWERKLFFFKEEKKKKGKNVPSPHQFYILTSVTNSSLPSRQHGIVLKAL